MDDTNGLIQVLVSGTGIANSDMSGDVQIDAEGETYVTARRVTQWQTALMYKHTQRIFQSTMEVMDQFVPKYYDHQLLRRCWGVLRYIIKVINLSERVRGPYTMKCYLHNLRRSLPS